MNGSLPLEIVEGVEAWHVVDPRGVLVMALPTRREADAFVAGYRNGRADAGKIVADQAALLTRVGRA